MEADCCKQVAPLELTSSVLGDSLNDPTCSVRYYNEVAPNCALGSNRGLLTFMTGFRLIQEMKQSWLSVPFLSAVVNLHKGMGRLSQNLWGSAERSTSGMSAIYPADVAEDAMPAPPTSFPAGTSSIPGIHQRFHISRGAVS